MPPSSPPAPPGAPPPAPAAAAAPTPKLTWSGLVDTYYLWNFSRADGANTLTGPVGRAFDTNANSFTMALAKLSLNAALDPVAFQLDFGYGSTGTIINGSGTGPSFLLEQAFGTISLPVGLPNPLTFDFGKFVTTAGAEVIEANKNWLYSRSFLFNAIPFLHTGVRANLKISDQLTVQASLVNGWNNDPDNNEFKTVGLNAAITASPMFSIFATTYFGKEATEAPMLTSTPGDMRFLGDLVVAATINDKVGLNLNIDYIKEGTPYTLGAALMGHFVINDHAYVSARGEFVVNHPETGSNTDLEEVTVMLGLPVGKDFELRPEVRGDFSNVDAYAGSTKKDQVTGEIAALTFF